MSNIISPKDRVRLKDGLTYRIEGQDVIVENSKGVRFTINAKEQIKLFEQMMAIFNEGYHTKREIVAQLISNYEGAVMTDTFHYSINRLWELGILQLESGKI